MRICGISCERAQRAGYRRRDDCARIGGGSDRDEGPWRVPLPVGRLRGRPAVHQIRQMPLLALPQRERQRIRRERLRVFDRLSLDARRRERRPIRSSRSAQFLNRFLPPMRLAASASHAKRQGGHHPGRISAGRSRSIAGSGSLLELTSALAIRRDRPAGFGLTPRELCPRVISTDLMQERRPGGHPRMGPLHLIETSTRCLHVVTRDAVDANSASSLSGHASPLRGVADIYKFLYSARR